MELRPETAQPRGPLFYVASGVIACALVAAAIAGYAALRPGDTHSPSGEATAMLQSIRGSEEGYRAEMRHYRSCPDDGDLSSADAYYPRPLGELSDSKAPWDNAAHANQLCWRDLGAHADGPVRFSYAIAAGSAGPVIVPRPPGVEAKDWPFDGSRRSDEPYFVAVAVGSLRGVKTASFVCSYDNEIRTITIPP